MSAVSSKGLVVSTERHASKTGVDVLRAGGNAIDAAVATAFTMAVSYPSCGNIGGEGFMLYHGADGELAAFDFRAVAPMKSSTKMFLNEKGELKGSPYEGALSVGVPGTVLGLELAHNKLGSMPWSDLIEPAIRLAANGFKVDERLHGEMKSCERTFKEYPSSGKVFLKKNGGFYKPGETLKQSDLASTLIRIQKEGSHDFYQGETAQLLVDFIQDNGGIMTRQDLADYKVIEREPLKGSYRDYDVYTIGPPSSGAQLLTMLNVLEGYDLAGMGYGSAMYLHLLTEVMRLSQRDRARYIGDPDFNPDLPLNMLSSKEYAEELRKHIDPNRAAVRSLVDIIMDWEKHETTHFSVVDSEGNTVSLTYTLNGDFGCEIVAEGTGIVLNNSMADFNVIPGRTNEKGRIGITPNLIEGGKRPLSSMVPTIFAIDGRPKLVLGSPGGRFIPSVVLQIALNCVDFGMSISDAVNAKRIHHGWQPDYTTMEEGVVEELTLSEYKEMGHIVFDREVSLQLHGGDYTNSPIGTAMCIQIDWENHVFYGAADQRSGDPSAFSVEEITE